MTREKGMASAADASLLKSCWTGFVFSVQRDNAVVEDKKIVERIEKTTRAQL